MRWRSFLIIPPRQAWPEYLFSEVRHKAYSIRVPTLTQDGDLLQQSANVANRINNSVLLVSTLSILLTFGNNTAQQQMMCPLVLVGVMSRENALQMPHFRVLRLFR